MVRRKIEITKIENKKARQICFAKRRQGLFKKAVELGALFHSKIAVVVFSDTGKLFDYGYPSVDAVDDYVVGRFLHSHQSTSIYNDPEIETRKMESDKSHQVRFAKRQQGLIKKAHELRTLCDAEIAIIIFSASGKPFTYGYPSMDSVMERFFCSRESTTMANNSPFHLSRQIPADLQQEITESSSHDLTLDSSKNVSTSVQGFSNESAHLEEEPMCPGLLCGSSTESSSDDLTPDCDLSAELFSCFEETPTDTGLLYANSAAGHGCLVQKNDPMDLELLYGSSVTRTDPSQVEPMYPELLHGSLADEPRLFAVGGHLQSRAVSWHFLLQAAI